MTPSDDIDLSEAGTGWAPELGASAVDYAGVFVYLPDRTNQSANPSRIVRVNLATLTAETWLAHDAGLPPMITGLCFSADYSTLFASSLFSGNLYAVNFGSKVVSDLGDIGANFEALYRLPSGEFLGHNPGQKNLALVQISGASVTVTADFLTANAWTPALSIDAAGNVFRAYQKSGPGTDGPIFHYVAGRFPVTRFDCGYLHNSGEISNGPAYASKFAAESLCVSGDGLTLYWSQAYRLKRCTGGAVDQVGDATAVKVVAVSNPLGAVLTRSYSVVNVWS